MTVVDEYVRVRGARQHNLKNINVDIPRDAVVVFTGVSGSGKSSLAFGTLYAEAQRRYLESVAPYARRLFDQMTVPDVDSIEGLPPAVSLQQHRGTPTTRSSVGSMTTLSNLLRMLYSRAGTYPRGAQMLAADSFSANTVEGACPKCHGVGRVYDVTETSLVPDASRSIRERAIAAWPSAWHGQNLRDICVTLGFDIDAPWKSLSRKDRQWLLFTEDQPRVPVYAGYSAAEVKKARARGETPSYMGTFSSARRYVFHTVAQTSSPHLKRRAHEHMISRGCSLCRGRRLRRRALAVRFAGLNITEMSRLPLQGLSDLLNNVTDAHASVHEKSETLHPERELVIHRIRVDMLARLETLLALGLGYLSMERTSPTLSPGELQRLRLATQIRSNLFGVVYVLDEPSAGLHPVDTDALVAALKRLKGSGNSLFVVEHNLDVIRHADWIVDVGPAAGEHGGELLYSGPLNGLRKVERSVTRRYLFPTEEGTHRGARAPTVRTPTGWLELAGVSRNNVRAISVAFPLGVLTAVTGVSGSGKSSLVSRALLELVGAERGHEARGEAGEVDAVLSAPATRATGRVVRGIEHIARVVSVDQRPIGRTPRSNLATYLGFFDRIRGLFAATPTARARRYDAGRFSFNVAKGRCERCAGDGVVFIELLFMPGVYAQCPVCHGARYNAKTLEVQYQGKSIADVLHMSVNEAHSFFAGTPQIARPLVVLQEVGLGYIRLGQPATELSGGEAQRIKLATELQRIARGGTLYVLDEPTTGLHPFDVEALMAQLNALVDAGNTVVVVEHDMNVVAASDYVIEIGPGAGDAGGRLVACGSPSEIVRAETQSAPALRRALAQRSGVLGRAEHERGR